MFVLGLCCGCGMIGLWPVDQWVSWMWVGGLWLVGQWWWVVDPWVAMVCWCDCHGVIVIMVCRGVIVVMVWWFACSISKKRETKRKREKKIEIMVLYMMTILL